MLVMGHVEEIKQLTDTLNHHNHQYYLLDEPTISDHEWDTMYHRLLQLESQHPELVQSDSPTQRVGGGLVTHLTHVTHDSKMLSLDNAFNKDQLRTWFSKLPEGTVVVAEPKLDGMALSLTYIDGKLSTGVTRGDGEVGEDVTHNVRTIRKLPTTIKTLANKVVIRGEVVMGKQAFKEYNEIAVAVGEKTFVNPRNAAAGSMRLLDSTVASKRPLQFIPYEVATYEGDPLLGGIVDHIESMSMIHEYGINDSIQYVCLSIEDLYKTVDELTEGRDGYPYPIDGIVFKVSDYKTREALGSTVRSPRWAIAYKFPEQRSISPLIDVKYQVGRTGVITPVAVIEPVVVGDVTVSNVTLHNADEMTRLNLTEGCSVEVHRAGDVIPKIRKTIPHPTVKGELIKFITHCPDCDTELSKEDDGVLIYCPNSHSCPSQLIRLIHNLSNRDSFYITGLGIKVCEGLVRSGLVKKLSDVWDVENNTSQASLVNNEVCGVTNAEKLVTAITKSKTKDLPTFLCGLGLHGFGKNSCIEISETFGTLDVVRNLTVSDVMERMNATEYTANRLVSQLNDPKMVAIIDEMINVHGLIALDHKVVSKVDQLTFCFTGGFDVGKAELIEMTQLNGHKVSNSLSKKVTHLVVGSNPGSKKDKVLDMPNVKVIDVDQFISLMGD